MASETLDLYLKFGRYILIAPFKVTHVNKPATSYKCTKSHWLLQILMCLVQITTVAMMCVFDWVDAHGVFVRSLLRSSVYSLFNAYAAIGLATVWCGVRGFERTLNAIKRLENLMKASGVKLPSAKGMLRIVVVAISFILICTGTELLVIYVTIYNGFYKGFGRYLSLSSFLVDGQANCTDFDPSLHTDCRGSFAVATLAVMFWLSAGFLRLYVYFLNFLCFVHALILLCFANSLLAHLKILSNNGNGNIIIRLANEMLHLSATMEDGLGMLVLSFCLALIPYYSFGFQSVLNRADLQKAIRHLMNSAIFIAILLTAAEANSKMKKIGGEIGARASAILDDTEAKNSMEMDKEKSLLLLQRIQSDEFGLQGKAFAVTYGFVGSVAGLVITYTIIIYQFQGN